MIKTMLGTKSVKSLIVFKIEQKQEGNADPALKPDFHIFLLIFQHKWMFLSTMQTLPFEGHTVAYQCKGLEQSKITRVTSQKWF